MPLPGRHLDAGEARAVVAWRYSSPFDAYDLTEGDITRLRAPQPGDEGYYPLIDPDGVLAAFLVFGAEARVPGQEPVPGVLDLGFGLRPDLLGRGLGTALLDEVLTAAADWFQPRVHRAAVATWNGRSLALLHRAGFVPTRDLDGTNGRVFHELEMSWRERG